VQFRADDRGLETRVVSSELSPANSFLADEGRAEAAPSSRRAGILSPGILRLPQIQAEAIVQRAVCQLPGPLPPLFPRAIALE